MVVAEGGEGEPGWTRAAQAAMEVKREGEVITIPNKPARPVVSYTD